MNRILHFLWAAALTLSFVVPSFSDAEAVKPLQEVSLKAKPRTDNLSKSKKHKCSSKKPHHHKTQLKSAYPWEYIQDNVKTFKFVVMNFYTDLFDPATVSDISKNLEKYVAKYVFPSWRHKISIEFFTPPSQETLAADALIPNHYTNAVPQSGTFIPIILTNDFSSNIPNNFATAVHGNVSASPTTGYNASLYIDEDFYTLTGPVPFGTPFIVIPASSAANGNGINGLIAANQASGQGPTDFYQALSLTLSQEIISVLVDPTAAQYVGTGNPLGGPTGGPLPDGTSGVTTNQIFYAMDATAPFLYGNDNIVHYHGWSMGNFALPAYFFPNSNTGDYDLLGRTSAPFTPYKGTQFLIYQNFFVTNYPEGTVTDLLVGTNVSPLCRPSNIMLVEGGSIYSYTGWDMEIIPTLSDEPTDSATRTIRAKGNPATLSSNSLGKKKKPAVYPSIVANGRNRNSKQFQQGIAKAKKFGKCKKYKKSKKSKKPELLPFQFIDKDGFLTTRIAIINYIPDILPPADIDTALPVVAKYIQEEYLPYWNRRVVYKNYTVLPGDVGLPEFDGTFIPFFYLNIDQFDVTKLGAGPLAGGAYNENNAPNILAGPFLSEYLKATPDFSVPNIPLGNPYLLVSAANYVGQVTVTTDQAGLGPFTAIPLGSSVLIPTTFPIVAVGANADPLNACSPLVNNLTGKIGVNLRSGCNSAVYPQNMADAGAIAFLTVYNGGAQLFSGLPSDTIWGATLGPDGDALISALATNPNITITISAPTISPSDLNAFTGDTTHESMELSMDPNYSTYLLTFNPAVDSAVLFSQLEPADPDENLGVVGTKGDHSYAMSSFPLPSYFDAYLRINNYDNVGINWRALVPESRQQCVFHFKSAPDTPFNPLTWGGVLGPTENGFFPGLTVNVQGSIFNPHTSGWYPPQEPPVLSGVPVEDTPLNTIYEALMNLRDVLFI